MTGPVRPQPVSFPSMRTHLPLLTRVLLILALAFNGWPVLAHAHGAGSEPVAPALAAAPAANAGHDCHTPEPATPAADTADTGHASHACCEGEPCAGCGCVLQVPTATLAAALLLAAAPGGALAGAHRTGGHGSPPDRMLRPPIA